VNVCVRGLRSATPGWQGGRSCAVSQPRRVGWRRLLWGLLLFCQIVLFWPVWWGSCTGKPLVPVGIADLHPASFELFYGRSLDKLIFVRALFLSSPANVPHAVVFGFLVPFFPGPWLFNRNTAFNRKITTRRKGSNQKTQRTACSTHPSARSRGKRLRTEAAQGSIRKRPSRGGVIPRISRFADEGLVLLFCFSGCHHMGENNND